MTTVEYDSSDSIATIRLNRPERLNAVTPALVSDLVAALRRAEADQVGAVVLSGNGRSFCAGHDLQEHEPDATLSSVRAQVEMIQDVTRMVRRLPCPVVASVHGFALGAGCEFALCCDLVVASSSATFGFPEVGVGLSVTGGISHVLPITVGFVRAKELLLLGERFTADQAHAWGLVNRVVPADSLESTTLDLARALAALPRLAVSLAKQVLDHGPGADMDRALLSEMHHAQMAMTSAAAAEAADGFRTRER